MELHQLKLQDPFNIGINLRNVQHLIALPSMSELDNENANNLDNIGQTEKQMEIIDTKRLSEKIDEILKEPIAGESTLPEGCFEKKTISTLQKINLQEN